MKLFDRNRNSAGPLSQGFVIPVVIVFALIVVGLQVLSTWQNTHHAGKIVEQIKAIDQQENLTNEKTRSEIIKLRVESELRGFFWQSLLTGLVPLVTAFVAVVTVLIGLRKYLDTREKERLDRAAEDLRSALSQLASKEARERAVGVVGLQHFFSFDKQGYHLRAMSALAAAARLEEDAEVLRSIRISMEQAIRTVDASVLQEISWQGVHLENVDFSLRKLSKIDFRDADLENADLSNCDLSSTRMTNTRLKGARLINANLTGADLAYADFAGASLKNANLADANLRHVKVLDLDLNGADLRSANFDSAEFPWELTRNWRNARLDETVKKRLLERYGALPSGAAVFMLMWEMPPLVAGGTWTACYHLVRNLRQQGADIKVVVPWDEAMILQAPFGREVEVIPLGIRLPEPASSVYGTAQGWWSPYNGSGGTPSWNSPYGFAGVYGSSNAMWSPYAASISPYGGSIASARLYSSGTTLLRLTGEFKQRLKRLTRSEPFDIIHAHDWVTFAAAQAVSSAHGKPWVAHFHSLEADRRPRKPDSIIAHIEMEAVNKADHLAVPSKMTKGRLEQLYNAPQERITVVPNSLSPSPVTPAEMGEFETRRVVFLGRLTEQKGLDRFAEVAAFLRQSETSISFVVYGAGEEGYRYSSVLSLQGPLDWHERTKAFRGASVVLVPSRSEPFGMVVLEAMLHRVPVVYPVSAGVAEVIRSGIPLDTGDIAAMAESIRKLLSDRVYWENIVKQQFAEIGAFPHRRFEKTLQSLWKELIGNDERVLADADGQV